MKQTLFTNSPIINPITKEIMSQAFIIFLHLIISLVNKTNGLNMKMIPIDSPHLQIIPNDFTNDERHQFLINISMSRAYNAPSLSPNGFKMPLRGVKSSFYVTNLVVGTGTGALGPFVLLDTGSDDTWIQCDGCDPCFQLRLKNFTYKDSPTYKRIDLYDPRCDTRRTFQGSCGFTNVYGMGNQYVNGFLGTDTFLFKNAKTDQTEFFPNVVFGCALKNVGIDFGANSRPQNVIAGIHGLAPGPKSFLVQLDSYTRGRFSYCLPSWTVQTPGVMSIMYFGDEAQISGDASNDVQSVSMAPNAKRYHLYLNAISVDGNRLSIDPSIFELDTVYYRKGFFIDSGSPYTILAKSAYDVFKAAMVNFFNEKYGWQPMAKGLNFDLCYSAYPEDGQSFPTVILHLVQKAAGDKEVDMVLDNDNVFQKIGDNQGFCLMFISIADPGPCLFGAFQHANFHVLYDVYNWFFSFVPANCAEINL